MKPTDIVFLVHDVSRVGGISRRTLNTLNGSAGRDVRYWCFSARNAGGLERPDVTFIHDDKSVLDAALAALPPLTTVLVSANTVIRRFWDLSPHLTNYPLIHLHAGQITWFIQNNRLAGDIDFVQRYRAQAVIALTRADALVQRQMGLHGQDIVSPPCPQRDRNDYDPKINTRIGYVGRIDYPTKGTDQLLPIIREMRERKMDPMLVYTTDGKNSPDLPRFEASLQEFGLTNAVEIVKDCTDPGVIYRKLAFVLVPSRQESFGNVVTEALSHGVPVIATRYAPGPAEIIRDLDCGFLLDRFEPRSVLDRANLSLTQRRAMSEAAFARHRDFTLDAYYDALEDVVARAIDAKAAGVSLPVYPELAAVADPPAALLKRICPPPTDKRAKSKKDLRPKSFSRRLRRLMG
ncbi:glycosyltransferase family 4 protein [Notoacmeibacter ruber]|uniref:Glycosyltransferase family 1 protein n=1 Tax=Notoacmeibacter ruber TaxID=2670375 RepID=A0A3L7J666_9HYPH|nr:glycosyltransferase [Notoacmeibacter ruber]RLQ85001.1 glycosyltransferase family 1 protein [Notoacmeibacter ruber]